ncbi:protein pygopus-like [Watersipora subatra]|uniref:protein pygopus-like n=1 Tax=Watersipora subatra TaxID=2589382 RepID=UPI00355C26DB
MAGSESGENPRTPASEPAKSQPSSPKKRRKVSRSQSIPAQVNNPSSFYPPPNAYAGPMDPMGAPHPYGDPMQAPHMSNAMQPVDMMPGPPHHPGQPMMHGANGLPMHMHPGAPANGGHPMAHASNPRYMRQSSAPMPPPHMSPHSGLHGTPPMHPQGMSPHAHMGPGGPLPQGMPQQPYSPGMPGAIPSSMPSPVPSTMPPATLGHNYPPDQPVIFNPSNPNAPPIYPCGICRKEIVESDQVVLCESGCKFWFHRQCTGLTEHAFQLLTQEVFAEWVCDNCFRTKNIPLIKTRL